MSITVTTWYLEQTSPADLRPATPARARAAAPDGEGPLIMRAETPPRSSAASSTPPSARTSAGPTGWR
ncbi:hypothetical protein ACFQVA_34710 [Actinomadura keratinilytica]